MIRILALVAVAILLSGLAAWWVLRAATASLPAADAETVAAAYAAPLTPPDGALRVFHLGHSLVGRDMPAMLEQLAGPGHFHQSQLGWGTSLREHWEPDLPVNGFDTENAHDRFRPARDAVASCDYDAVVLTEMVEIRDAIAYHDSGRYLNAWADLARGAAPAPRVYLYESWPRLDDPEGWLNRLDADTGRYWKDRILFVDLAARGEGAAPVYLIPAGRVMAAFVRRLEDAGGIGALTTREDLFARGPDGATDPIHVNDIGAYLVALTHYAVLYHASPIGLPHALLRADGTPAQAPGAEAARAMQETVWQVVRSMPETGLPQ